MAGYSVKDISLKKTKALPNGAASTTTDAIDLEIGSRSDFVAPVELLITAPALATGVMGDGKTMKYDVLMSANSDLSSPTVIAKEVLVQTGAGGAGAATNTARFRLPSNVARYIGAKATGSTTGDCSGSSMTIELLS